MLQRLLTKKNMTQSGAGLEARFKPGFLKAAVFGANDGVVTTFAVVAGVAGAGLDARIVLILGIANLLADGFSMGVGDYLGEKAEADLRQKHATTVRSQPRNVWMTGVITFIWFIIAGSFPLIPYAFQLAGWNLAAHQQLLISIVTTAVALFLIGSVRTIVSGGHWMRNGIQTLIIGAVAAVVAYLAGGVIESFLL
jgi:VIT1/CCC1 family predicted Fe2+/Mn2+ transporter